LYDVEIAFIEASCGRLDVLGLKPASFDMPSSFLLFKREREPGGKNAFQRPKSKTSTNTLGQKRHENAGQMRV
jgi:hypothetical protein